MCDTLLKQNIPKKEIPQYVYKRVQKVANGKYVTPVMGEPLYKGSWKGAKSYKAPISLSRGLVEYLKTKFPKTSWRNSSSWACHHVGRWASFKTLDGAKYADLISNFINDSGDLFPTIIVKCEIRGDVSYAHFSGSHTYLSSQIRVVEEVSKI